MHQVGKSPNRPDPWEMYWGKLRGGGGRLGEKLPGGGVALETVSDLSGPSRLLI